MCAQRLSASMVGSPLAGRARVGARSCSTPFGINGRVALLRRVGRLAVASCSTPFGINGRVAGQRAIALCKSGDVLNAFRHQWSGRNPGGGDRRLARPVLNAFRHQWSGRVRGWRIPAQIAIVLNAFRHQWSGRSDRARRGIPGALVLNAFRHQWSGRPTGRTRQCRTRSVLNAFRHQWSGRVGSPCSTSLLPRAQRLSASMVGSPARAGQALGAFLVLNAFRHQWSGRLKDFNHFATGIMCSTPFGINGRVAGKDRSDGAGQNRAQRLSASMVGSLGTRIAFVSAVLVLNAFRHQWSGREKDRGNRFKKFNVLNAFRHQWSGRRFEKNNLDLALKCSTPFGINGRVARLALGSLLFRCSCSTPFGINGRVARPEQEALYRG